jgi:hypothetical protein
MYFLVVILVVKGIMNKYYYVVFVFVLYDVYLTILQRPMHSSHSI